MVIRYFREEPKQRIWERSVLERPNRVLLGYRVTQIQTLVPSEVGRGGENSPLGLQESVTLTTST